MGELVRIPAWGLMFSTTLGDVCMREEKRHTARTHFRRGLLTCPKAVASTDYNSKHAPHGPTKSGEFVSCCLAVDELGISVVGVDTVALFYIADGDIADVRMLVYIWYYGSIRRADGRGR